MKAYMGYSRAGGASEGAILIFAESHDAAKKLGFPTIQSFFDSEWTDCAIELLDDLPTHLKALDTGSPQVLDSPPGCSTCEDWGGHPCENDRCSLCESDENY